MGRRSSAETVVAIFAAFVERRSWSQAALARRLDLGVPAVRRHLVELSRLLPLAAETDHPHVVWSLPERWFPGGVYLSDQHGEDLVRLLARTPPSALRDRLVGALTEGVDEQTAVAVAAEPVDEAHLSHLEDAARDGHRLAIDYYSAHSGHVERGRLVSVQRVILGSHHRFVAHCHRSDALKYFRVSRVHRVVPRPDLPYVSMASSAVDHFLAESIQGFHTDDEPVAVTFVVRNPEARWVRDNLPVPLEVEPHPDGLRFAGSVRPLLMLARYVVGLGDAARCETPELSRAVRRLARGALAASRPGIRSVTSIRSTESNIHEG
ncbi:MAG: WYL domain-containing protein [Myxococcota bacterium]